MLNYKDEVIEKLKQYSEDDIIFTDHAKIQAAFRQIKLKEVVENILNPEKLVYAEKQPAKKQREEKYSCYFKYSIIQTHRYILVLGEKVIIPTVIRVNRRWQSLVEK